MENKKFNNRPNDHVSYYFYSQYSGTKIRQDFFISRSCAVVGVILAYTSTGMRVLIEKRSNKMMDEASKVGIPCGYLDWDETLYEAMMREVYEETSFYIPDYEKYVIFDNNKQPFFVKDNPKTDKRQNVSHIYLTVFDFQDSQQAIDAFPADIEKYSDKEIAWIKWMKLLDFYSTRQDYEWAFNHDETIESAIKFYNKNFDYKKRNE
jgi:8-oxo-dGTP pyrophosphatase MutT (NUDIX family)